MAEREFVHEAGLPELGRCLSEAGYTPPVRALPALLAELERAADATAPSLERALARAGAPVVTQALAAFERAREPGRIRLLSLLVRCSGAGEREPLLGLFMHALGEPSPRARKLAARGLGKLGDARAEPALLVALGSAAGPEAKAIVDALGSVGGELGAGSLAALVSRDADLLRRRDRARLLIERRGVRSAPGELLLDSALQRPARVLLSCRAGLAELLATELARAWSPRVRGPERVEVEHGGSLRELLGARTALDVALVARLEPEPAAPEERIARALARPEMLEALGSWTRGVPRFRVAWADGGHHRALTWRLAAAVRARTSGVVNDSHAAPWTLRVSPAAVGELELVPRLEQDPRFLHRRAAVPAASHPTLAAALALFAGVREDDVVWDPFVGSGLELIERARLGPLLELWGSDIDGRALAAARTNLEAAGLGQARLVEADARVFAPAGVSLIITNPPMGRRVARDGTLGGLLESFLAHAAAVLRPGGRLAWLSPLPGATERRARRLGLQVTPGPDVDLGGFSARLQLLVRPP